MADGGLSTEEMGRKSQLDETVAKTRRSYSLTNQLKNFQSGLQTKGISNVIDSSLLAAKNDRTPTLSGSMADHWFQRQIGEKPGGLPQNSSATLPDQSPGSPEQPSDPVKADQQAGQQNESARQTQLLAGQQKSRLKEKILEESGANKAMDEVREKTRKEAEKLKKKFIKWARTGVDELATSICNALDLGTAGVSTVVTVFGYAVTLTDLNAQMIWGYYIKHDKSFLIPALGWDPIKVPKKILSPRIVHAALLIVDILVIGTITILTTLILLTLLLPQILLAGGILTSLSFISDFIF
jgi:hypothetical protein